MSVYRAESWHWDPVFFFFFERNMNGIDDLQDPAGGPPTSGSPEFGSKATYLNSEAGHPM